MIAFAIFQTGRSANGGVESVTKLMCGLPEFEKIAFTQKETEKSAYWRASGIRVTLLCSDWPSAGGGRVGSYCRKLRHIAVSNFRFARMIIAGRVRVLHVNDPAPFWYLVPVARLFGLRVILNLRDTKADGERLSLLKYSIYFLLSSRILLLSSEMIGFYSAVPFGRRKFSAFYSVVEERFFEAALIWPDRHALRERLGLPAMSYLVGFVATFNDKKNQLGFIKNCGDGWLDSFPGVHVAFVGDFGEEGDAYGRQCLEAVAQHDLTTHFHFLGFKREMDLWYRACDVILVPTRKEGLARCMIEALACATPVVSFDVCSAREILEPISARLVVKQGCYADLMSALRWVLEDGARRRDLEMRSAKRARECFSATEVLAGARYFYSPDVDQSL